MAIIKCLECGAEISDKADSCIKCGCPINRDGKKETEKPQKGRAKLIVFMFAVLIVVGAIIIVSLNKVPEGFTKEYYREAEQFIVDCERYIENPTDENYPEDGEYYEKIMDENPFESTKYTTKDFALAEQQLFTDTAALLYGIGKCTEEEFREEIEAMKELMR